MTSPSRLRAAIEANKKTRPKDDPVARIDALTRNARNTWLVLLGALVFVSVTLMGVEHIDFYGVDRATALPLVNVSVPTRLFFAGAPILLAAIYGYFHLYLIRLWDALGRADALENGIPLGDRVTPWLVTDAALDLRNRIRKDYCATPRTMELPAMLLNLGLAWVFGLAVLAALWWLSMPARTLWLTLAGAVSLLAALAAGASSFAMLIRRTRDGGAADHRLWRTAPFMGGLLLALLVLPVSGMRTMGPLDGPHAVFRLAPISLVGEQIVPRPADWVSPAYAKRDFRDTWCKREGLPDCTNFGSREREFETEWKDRRRDTLASLKLPDFNGVSRVEAEKVADAAASKARSDTRLSGEPRQSNAARRSALAELSLKAADLGGADLRQIFLAGADLATVRLNKTNLQSARLEGTVFVGAQMKGADLSWAQMEGAVLSWAQMEGAVLSWAQMEGAVLSWAQMEGADLSGAQLEGADLRWTQMEEVYLNSAQLEGAYLYRAQMEGADLRWAQMDGAYLNSAQMEGAVLSWAQMEGADLSEAQMEGAVLSWTQMEGVYLYRAQMEGAYLYRAQMEGAYLYRAQMEGADLSEAQMEGAYLSGANLKSVEWAGANLRSPAHATDFRGAVGLTQEQLAQVIGNERTLLPPGLHVWSCWAEAPPELDQMIERAGFFEDPEDLKRDWLCPEGTEPQPTGTQLGLDETPPWEE